MNPYGEPETEAVNAETAELDALDTVDLVRLLLEQQREALSASRDAAASIARAIDVTKERLRAGGTLHYAGAGTSGRLGFLDASEMPPTFGTAPQLVCAHIAGRREALTRAIEGAEDDAAAAESELRDHVASGDVLLGMSASGSAPYTIRAVEVARNVGAWTIAIVNSRGSALERAADDSVVLLTGAEPIAGSTRLKAGTAQKIVLNTISTAVMVALGKVHGNLMVDVVATNAKLRRRAVRLVMQLASVDEARAKALLRSTSGSVKAAVVVQKCRVDAARARTLLEEGGGSLRAALSTAP